MNGQILKLIMMIMLMFAAAWSSLAAGEGSAAYPSFIRAQGEQLVLVGGGSEIHLRGVNMDNQFVVTDDERWLLDDAHDEGTPALNKYSNVDFAAVAAMGMNVIRSNLSYRIFEDNRRPYTYKPEAWRWLDGQVSLARKHGLYLILAMMVPQGGYQPSGGGGAGQWDVAEKQNRLKSLWRAIALRYQNEPVIAGYDILNEPNPSRSGYQWQKLSQQLVDEIRQVDRRHLIIVEMVNWVVSADGESPESPDVLDAQQFLLNDRAGAGNIMYDFHFYQPMSYTHQLVPWGSPDDGGSYPDRRIKENTYQAEGYYQQDFMARDKAYLEHELRYFSAFGRQNHVPMNIGEWGANPLTCVGGKGCFAYTTDMLDLINKMGLNYTFYTYDWIRISDYEEYELLADYPQVVTEIRQRMKNIFRARHD